MSAFAKYLEKKRSFESTSTLTSPTDAEMQMRRQAKQRREANL